MCFKTTALDTLKLVHADVSYPCLAIETRENPGRQRFRVVDGKHRLHRMLDADPQCGSALFVVLSANDVKRSAAVALVPACSIRSGG